MLTQTKQSRRQSCRRLFDFSLLLFYSYVITQHTEVSMRELTPEEVKGMENEERFLKLVKQAVLPSWIPGIVRSTLKEDACGIDAVAAVARWKGGAFVRVPIQIKSSYTGVEHHFLKYPQDWRARVVVVVVNEYHSNKAILEELTKALKHVRMHQYDYEDIFQFIECAVIPTCVLENIVHIRRGAVNEQVEAGVLRPR
jgi:hypothetical protein